MYLKPQAFTALFQDIQANHQKILAALNLLAHHVTDCHLWNCQADRDDAAANAAMASISKINRFDCGRGNAFNYFTEVIKNDLRQQHRNRVLAMQRVIYGYTPGEPHESLSVQVGEKDNTVRNELAKELGPEIAPTPKHKSAKAPKPVKPSGEDVLREAEGLLKGKPELTIDLVRQLKRRVSYEQIAKLLNSHGYQTQLGRAWKESNVINKVRLGTFETLPRKRSAGSNIGGPLRTCYLDEAKALLAGTPPLTGSLVKQVGGYVTQQKLISLLNHYGYRNKSGKPWTYTNLRHAIAAQKKMKSNGDLGKIVPAVICTRMSESKIKPEVNTDVVARKAEIFDIQVGQDTLKAKWDELEKLKGSKLNELKEVLQSQAESE